MKSCINFSSVKYQFRFACNALILFLLISCSSETKSQFGKDDGSIQVYKSNSFYWEYKNKPVLLLGGSVDDNLFQIDELEAHLDLLQSVGGNYVRCTMSSRDEGNTKPYLQNNGLFDLNKPNPEYWSKFEHLLKLAQARDIIVQVEIWATYDFYHGEGKWEQNPFNPKVNSNYTASLSMLPDSVDYPPQFKNNPFFQTVPSLKNNTLVLPFQKKFVEQLLSVSLRYPNVLYSIDNESMTDPEWPKFWSNYIREYAKRQGKIIYVTEMWDKWDPTDGQVEGAITQHPELGDWYARYSNMDLYARAKVSNTIEDPMTYQFVEVSNNNAQRGEVHFQTAQFVHKKIEASGKPRPINNVKIYGNDEVNSEWAGPRTNAEECFWRNIFAGHASSRFHRPVWGIGLNADAQKQIKSLRMLTDSLDFFNHRPAPDLLSERSDNEAYSIAKPGEEYAVYFPGQGEIFLNGEPGTYLYKALDITASKWHEFESIKLPGIVTAPDDHQWALWLRRLHE